MGVIYEDKWHDETREKNMSIYLQGLKKGIGGNYNPKVYFSSYLGIVSGISLH